MHKLKIIKKGSRIETKEITQTKKNNVTREVKSTVITWVEEYQESKEISRKESLRKLGLIK